MCLAQRHNSEAGEARTRDPSVSSEALYHRATVLPEWEVKHKLKQKEILTLVLLKSNISHLGNSADPDQLVSDEAICSEATVFHAACKCMLITG